MLFTVDILVPSLSARTFIEVKVGTPFIYIKQALENMFSIAEWRSTIIYISLGYKTKSERKIICGRLRLERDFTIKAIEEIYNDNLNELKLREDIYNKIVNMLKEMEENTK